MNSKGQSVFEYIFMMGCALLVAVTIIWFITSMTASPDVSSPAYRFCQAWAESKGYKLIDGQYNYHVFKGRNQLLCTYQELASTEVFDGAAEPVTDRKYKYFDISECVLNDWAEAHPLKINTCQKECS